MLEYRYFMYQSIYKFFVHNKTLVSTNSVLIQQNEWDFFPIFFLQIFYIKILNYLIFAGIKLQQENMTNSYLKRVHKWVFIWFCVVWQRLNWVFMFVKKVYGIMLLWYILVWYNNFVMSACYTLVGILDYVVFKIMSFVFESLKC